jgi:putative transposase
MARKRVARLMRAAERQGATRRSKFTTQRDRHARPAPELVDRKFEATGPDQLP